MKPSHLLWSSLLALSLPACVAPDAEPGDPLAGLDSVSFDVTATIESGQETQLCKFVTMPKDRGDMASPAATHSYSAGSHHILLYRTDLAEIPEGAEGFLPCDDQRVR